MKKKLITALLTAALAMTLAACGAPSENPSEDPSAPASPELVKVTLGTVAWPTNEMFYLAKEKGIFAANGIDVEIKEFTSTSESSAAFISGNVDFCTYASSETIAPYAQGGALNVVLITDKSNGCEGLVATPDIKTIEDLKGKTVATQMYSVDHMFLLMLLDDAGMSADDITVVDMTIEAAGNAFVAGQVDAACIWDPYFSQARDAGGTVLFSSADDPDLITDVVAASDEIIAEHPEAVRGLIRSYYDTVEYWKNNTAEASAYMGEKMGVSAEDFDAMMAGLIIPSNDQVIAAFTPAENYAYWPYTQNKVQEFMKALGAIDTDVDCSGMIDDSFVKDLAG